MSIILFSKYDWKGASSRVRYFQFLPLVGQNIFIFPLISNSQLVFKYRYGFYPPSLILRYFYRLFVIIFLKRNGSVCLLVEKEIFPGFPAFCESWIYKKFDVILDYDDGQHLAGSKYSILARVAKRVTVGSRNLQEYYALFNPKVIYYPSTMKGSDGFMNRGVYRRILWIGSPSTSSQLDLIFPGIVKWCEINDWCLRVVGYHGTYARIYSESNFVEFMDWSLEYEYKFFQNVDVGLMPLESTEWNKFKCSYKLIQYMAYSIPVLASAVGENIQVVKNGLNGFLVEDVSDFVDVLTSFSEKEITQLRRGARMLYENELSFDIALKIFKKTCVES